MQQRRDHTQEVIVYAAGRSRLDLDTDRDLELILTRLLEVVGEAANRIPRSEQKNYPDIPWSQIISLRNRIIHGYNQIDHSVVWRIVSE